MEKSAGKIIKITSHVVHCIQQKDCDVKRKNTAINASIFKNHNKDTDSYL